MTQPFLPSEAIQMLVSSTTTERSATLPKLEVKRFLNAVARAQSGVPTGVPNSGRKESQ